MRCPEIRPLLSEYLDGEVSPACARRVEAHLETCPGCQASFHALRRTVQLVARHGVEQCPVEVRGAVLQAVAHRRPEPRRRAAHWPVFGGAVVSAAGLCTAVVLGLVRTPAAVERPAPPAPPAVHQQFYLASGLGVADGLMLSAPSDAGEAREHDPTRD
jgi:anti-sigma factor RsiW